MPTETWKLEAAQGDHKNLQAQACLSVSEAVSPTGIFIVSPSNSEKKNRYRFPNKTSSLINTEPSEVDKEYLVMCADKWQIALSLTKLPLIYIEISPKHIVNHLGAYE